MVDGRTERKHKRKGLDDVGGVEAGGTGGEAQVVPKVCPQLPAQARLQARRKGAEGGRKEEK